MINILCNNCIHKEICSKKKHYNNLVDYIDKYDNKSEHFDDFQINVYCKNYWKTDNSLANIK